MPPSPESKQNIQKIVTLKPRYRGWWWTHAEVAALVGVDDDAVRALPASFWASNNWHCAKGGGAAGEEGVAFVYARRRAWDSIAEHAPRHSLSEQARELAARSTARHLNLK